MPRTTGLPALSGLQQQIVAHLLNRVAFQDYGDCCSVDDLAAQFGRTPGRFLPVLRRLVDKGYVTLSGKTVQWVYPTAEALRQQDPTLSVQEAEKMVRKISGGKGRR